MSQDRREELQKRRQQGAKVDASPKNAIPPAKKSNEKKDTAKMMKKNVQIGIVIDPKRRNIKNVVAATIQYNTIQYNTIQLKKLGKELILLDLFT